MEPGGRTETTVRVLIVEDADGVARWLGRTVRRAGATPRRASTVAAARAELQAVAIDAAIVDLGLPDGCGSTVVLEARQRDRTLPIVVVTARRDPAVLNLAYLNDAHLVIKPAPSEHVERVVEQAFWYHWVGHRVLARAAAEVAAELSLSERERQVLALALQGRSQQEMASILGVALSSVRSHVGSLRAKAGKRRLQQVVAMVLRRVGGVEPRDGRPRA